MTTRAATSPDMGAHECAGPWAAGTPVHVRLSADFGRRSVVLRATDQAADGLPVALPPWLLRWWAHGDALAWAAAPLPQKIDVECVAHAQLLKSKFEDETVPARCTARLARMSTFPWTPTTSAVAAADASAADNAVLQSAQSWIASCKAQLDGVPMRTGCILMLLRNKRPAVFLVDTLVGPDGKPISDDIVFDDSCNVEFIVPWALHPTYDHGSALKTPLAGYKQEAETFVADVLQPSLSHGLSHKRLGIPPVRAALVTGPRGVGKEFMILHAVCSIARVPLIVVHLLEEIQAQRRSNGNRDALTPLRKAIWKARLCAPSVLYIDGIDILREDARFADLDRNDLAAHVAMLIQAIPSHPPICVVASTIDPKSLPGPLCPAADSSRPFSRVVSMQVPNLKQRRELCLTHLACASQACGLDIPNQQLESVAARLAENTPGYVNRDLHVLVTRAITSLSIAVNAKNVHRIQNSTDRDDLVDALPQRHLDATADAQRSTELNTSGTLKTPVAATLDWSIIQPWLAVIPPSQASHLGLDDIKCTVSWDSVGGYTEVKEKLRQLILWPQKRSETFERLGVRPPAGVLLYGPSGCGKTMLVHAISAESGMNFLAVKSHDIFSKYLGASEANIRSLFAASRQLAPCIVFIDEIDAVAARRKWTEDGAGGVNERVLSTLLNEMDGVQERRGVVVIACTNRPDRLDDALLRPGRLDRHVHVGLPTSSDRDGILKAIMRAGGASLVLSEEERSTVVNSTNDSTGADLSVLVREAGICALRESRDATAIYMRHVEQALLGAIPHGQGLFQQEVADQGLHMNAEGYQGRWWRPRAVSTADVARIEAFRIGVKDRNS